MNERDNERKTLKKLKILLADDNDADILITKRAFDKATLKTALYTVRDGQEVIDFLHEAEGRKDAERPRPDLILLDINMLRMNGIEVLDALKSDKRFKNIPVIMLTSSNNTQDIDRSFDHGACGYIQKPITYDEFQKMVEGFNYYWHHVTRLPGEEG